MVPVINIGMSPFRPEGHVVTKRGGAVVTLANDIDGHILLQFRITLLDSPLKNCYIFSRERTSIKWKVHDSPRHSSFLEIYYFSLAGLFHIVLNASCFLPVRTSSR